MKRIWLPTWPTNRRHVNSKELIVNQEYSELHLEMISKYSKQWITLKQAKRTTNLLNKAYTSLYQYVTQGRI